MLPYGTVQKPTSEAVMHLFSKKFGIRITADVLDKDRRTALQ